MTEQLDNDAPLAPAPEGAAQVDEADAPLPRQSAPYVRQRPAHRSVEPIDDLADEGAEFDRITHESGYTSKGMSLSGRGYRRSRAEGQQLRRDLHYGQYLEIPKGRRDIFVSRERKARVRSIIALIAVLAVLAVVIYFLWGYMQTNWGPTS